MPVKAAPSKMAAPKGATTTSPSLTKVMLNLQNAEERQEALSFIIKAMEVCI